MYSNLEAEIARRGISKRELAKAVAMAGDVVIMPRNTVMMIHNALFQYVTGNANSIGT